MDTLNIANVDELTDNIIEMMSYMNSNEMKDLKKRDINEYERMIENNFKEFTTTYYSIYKMILSGENIDMLYNMLSLLDKVNKKELKIENVIDKLRQDLANEYVYPIVNK